MSVNELIAKSYEIRSRIASATDTKERVNANMEMVGFLRACNAMHDLIGEDAALEIYSPRKMEGAK